MKKWQPRIPKSKYWLCRAARVVRVFLEPTDMLVTLCVDFGFHMVLPTIAANSAVLALSVLAKAILKHFKAGLNRRRTEHTYKTNQALRSICLSVGMDERELGANLRKQ